MPQDDEEKWYFWGLWKYDEKSLEYGNQWNTSHHISWATVEPQPNPTHIFENRKSLTQGSSAFDDLIYLSCDYLWSACWFSRQLKSSMKKADNLFTEGLRAPTMPWGSAPKCPGCDRTVYPMEQVPSFWILWNLTSFLGSHETCCHFLDPMEQVVIFLDPMEYVFIFGIS